MKLPVAFVGIQPFVRACGVYFLMLADEVVYVGCSINIGSRINQHRCNKPYDGVFWLPVEEYRLLEYESVLIRFFQPIYNATYYCQCYGDDNAVLVSLGLPPYADEAAVVEAYASEYSAHRSEVMRESVADRLPMAKRRNPPLRRDGTDSAGAVIRSWRLHRGLKQSELARACRVSNPLVSQFEIGTTTPTDERVKDLASALGVSVSEFWSGPPTDGGAS